MDFQNNRLTRSSSDKIIAGVLGGIAEHYNLNVSWLRIGVVLSGMLLSGVLVLAYIAAIFIMPENEGN